MSDPTKEIIKRNDDGTPWSEVRTIGGRKTLVAAISVGTQWKVVPATVAIAVLNGRTSEPAVGKSINRKAATAAALREITGRYARGEVH